MSHGLVVTLRGCFWFQEDILRCSGKMTQLRRCPLLVQRLHTESTTLSADQVYLYNKLHSERAFPNILLAWQITGTWLIDARSDSDITQYVTGRNPRVC
jgi:hypothetical protein